MLEEYQTVYDLLSRIFELKLFIQEGENSEDAPEEEYIELSDSKIKEELSYNLDKAAADWIISFMYLTTKLSDKDRAEKLIKMLETSISKNLKTKNSEGFRQELRNCLFYAICFRNCNC